MGLPGRRCAAWSGASARGQPAQPTTASAAAHTMAPMTAGPAITFDDFLKVDVRVGRIVDVQPFPTARKPAYQLVVDFGPELGRKRSSAQLTQRYEPADLLG